jgi:hypothetical protein
VEWINAMLDSKTACVGAEEAEEKSGKKLLRSYFKTSVLPLK